MCLPTRRKRRQKNKTRQSRTITRGLRISVVSIAYSYTMRLPAAREGQYYIVRGVLKNIISRRHGKMRNEK